MASPLIVDRERRLLIGGEDIVAADSFDAINPSTGEPWAVIPSANEGHVDEAVAQAKRAFRSFKATSPAYRQELLWRISERVLAEADNWPLLLATENGRPIREARFGDVPTCAGIFRYFSGLTRSHHGDQLPVEDPNTQVFTTREPLGPIAALIPWNSPIISLANKVAPALACGNTVILKPSEFASASVLDFAELIRDLLPPGVLTVLPGLGPDVGRALVSHPDIAKVTFTGGPETARHILAATAKNLRPALLELGGKGAFIICADADLDLAVEDALTGILLANGEACIAASRFLVDESIAEEFGERFAARAEQVAIGDARDDATEFGPLVTRAHRDAVLAAIGRAQGEGVATRTGGAAPDLPAPLRDGSFLAPTLLVDPAGKTSASCNEFFGPVAVLETFATLDEAVGRANDTPYGLAVGVWTRSLDTAHTVTRGLDAGIVWVNKWFDLPFGVPMGGVKDSGFGRELCAETMLEYSAPKVMNIGLATNRPPLWGAATTKD